MSEDTILVECDVCHTKVPKDKAVYDKGMHYPNIAKDKKDTDTVNLCQKCNQKLVERDIPNA